MDPKIRHVEIADIECCYEIEAEAYLPDEAATYEKIKIRAEQYPEGFIVLEVANKIIGFINSGCADKVVMSDENFKELKGHSSNAPNIVIMSVVLDPEYQGLGYASHLMNAFIKLAKSLNKKAIYLMCKEQYFKLYEKFGFKYIQISESTHGGVQWYEMKLDLQ
ncbi:GNAT family N-acetyltransferase [Acinetobacter baumannii]|uniref:GNAT family N-acetyltransferase n=1 Tax=Acinetobacter baumannii TaxID=470 RepID=UPI0038589D91